MTTEMARDENDDGRADEALATAARGGDGTAFAELWRRHAAAGKVAARQFAHIADADDLLSEASLRIFAALQRGGGPHGAFRPYLYRAIRNIALDWRRPPSVPLEEVGDDLTLPGPELDAIERTLGFRAFRSLPERWQTVLWYLDIEGLAPAEVAPILGLSPNAVSALAVRAREGLKKAWLQAHVNAAPPPEECRWTTARMGEYARGGLSRSGRERFDRHLETCARCTKLLAEVQDAGGRLAVLLLPVLLGGPAAATLLARRAERVDPPTSGAASTAWSAAHGPTLLVAAAAAAAAVVLAAGVAVAVGFSAAGDPPEVVAPPAPTETPVEPTPEPTPTPAAPTEPAPPPRVPVPVAPPAPPVTPPVVAPPAAPAAPVLGWDAATGRITATGSGDIPGATIELWGTTRSLVTQTTSAETLLASTLVAADGTWTTPDAGGVTPLNVTVFVRQVSAGVPSAPVVLATDVFFEPTASSTVAVVTGQVAEWHLSGWAGADWEVRDTGGSTVASGTFDSGGEAIATLTVPVAPSGTTFGYDYGYVQDGGILAASPGLSATVP